MGIIYYIVPIICLLGYLKRDSDTYLKFTLSLGFLLAGLRYDVIGYDYSVYDAYYNGTTNSINYEPAFIFLIALFKAIDLSFYFFILFISAFNHFSLYFLLKKLRLYFDVNPLLLLFFYATSGAYFWFTYTLTRQSISISIIFLIFAIYLGHKKSYKVQVVFLTAIASLYHIAGLIGSIIFIFKSHAIFNLKATLFFASVLAIVGFFYSDLLLEKINQYSGSEPGLGLLSILELILIIFINFYFVNDKKLNNLIYTSIIASLICYVVFYLTGLPIMRFIEPLKILIYIPVALFYYKVKADYKLLFMFTVIPLNFYRLHEFIVMFGDYGYPYKFIPIFTK